MRHYLRTALAQAPLPGCVVEAARPGELVAGTRFALAARTHQDRAIRAIPLPRVARPAEQRQSRAHRAPKRRRQAQFADQSALRVVPAAKLDNDTCTCGNLRRQPQQCALDTDRPGTPVAKQFARACPATALHTVPPNHENARKFADMQSAPRRSVHSLAAPAPAVDNVENPMRVYHIAHSAPLPPTESTRIRSRGSLRLPLGGDDGAFHRNAAVSGSR